MIIEFLKKQMKISRPFLFILSGILFFLSGCIVTSGFKNLEINKMTHTLSLERSRVVALEKEVIRKEMEWEKKLKKATKTITIKHPDGSEKIVETTDEESSEDGRLVVNIDKLTKSLSILDKTKESTTSSKPAGRNWTLNLSAVPNGMGDLSDFSSYKYSIGLERNIIGGISAGFVVEYKAGDVWFGVTTSYSF